MTTEAERSPSTLAKAQAPELRLLDRRAFVGFAPIIYAPGVVISDFALQIPDVTFPFSVTGGALRYQRRKLDFGSLEVRVDAEVIARELSQVAAQLTQLQDVKLHFRAGFVEGEACLAAGRTPLTFKVALDADGEAIVVHVYDVRMYGFSATPSAQVVVLIARAVASLDLLPGVQPRGAIGFGTRALRPLVQFAAVSRGYKVPSLDQARLSGVEISGKGVRLRFAATGISAPAALDEDLLLTLEGARAFADAEELLLEGKLLDARGLYLKRGDAHEAHPFAAERLLSLLVADPNAHDMALDVAASVGSRRKNSAAALWAEAVIREQRGENARAAERYLALCALSRKQGEETSAFYAAEAAARVARTDAPQLAVKALREVLGVRPDHLPSLQALARASDDALDRAGAIRAYRRIAALARDPNQAADAHLQLARLSAEAEDDVAGARLHCEAALRLAPDLPQALYQLAQLCHRSGDHLRAIKALERLREVAAASHEMELVGRANLLAGIVWDEGLQQLENALLRFRDAVSVMPAQAEPLYHLGRAAEKLGRLQESLSAYQQCVELAGQSPRDARVREAAHRSHHALARAFRTRLGDPARAREHLEAALALVPGDMEAIAELLPYFRATGRAAELADALEKAAAATQESHARAALWAEAGELYRGRLGQPEKAERLLESALEADPLHRRALEGMLALAETRRDGGRLCRCLKALAEVATEPAERIRCFRRLAVAAKELTFDFDLAAEALSQLLKLEPDDLTAMGELCAIHRKRGDVSGLALALERRAQSAEARGDARLAASVLRELAQVLEARLGRLGEAIVALEKAARLAPDPSLLVELGELCLRCDRLQQGRRALEEALSLQPRSTGAERLAEIRARLGRACDLLGDRNAAIAHYQQAFAIRRLDADVARRLEALYEEAGAIDSLVDLWATRAESLAAAGRAAEAAPMLLKSARALLAAGKSTAAVQRLGSALEAAPLGPHAGEVLEAMAEVELERGQAAEAARLLARRAALSTDPRLAAQIFFKASALVRGTGAEHHHLAECVAQDPTFAPARIRRGEIAAQTSPADALEDFEAALSAPAGDPEAPREAERVELLRRAAIAARRSNRKEAAQRYFALYLAQRPDDIEAHRELVNALRDADAKEALREQLQKLWPKLSGTERVERCREYAELSRELAHGDVPEEALRLLLEADPGDSWAARSLLALLAPPSAADSAQAEERFKLVSLLIPASRGSERARLLRQRAAHYRRLGQLDDARADLLEAAECSDEPAAIIAELVEDAQGATDPFAELSAWKLAVRLPQMQESAAPRLLKLGQLLASRKEWPAAQECFALCAALDAASASDRCEAFAGLADASDALGDRARAAAALWDASRQGPLPLRVESLLRRAKMLESERDLSTAGQSYESALVLDAGNPEARAGLKRVLGALEDWSGLAELIAAEAASAPRPAALLEELAIIYLDRLNQKGPAEAALHKAAQLDPDNLRVRRRLVALLAERGEIAAACELLEELGQAISPADRAGLLRELVAVSRQRGEMELAVRLARKAHALDPARGEALRELAELLYLRGSVSEALPLQRELADQVEFEDAPDLAEDALLRLADLAEQADEPELARSTLRRLLEHRPLCAPAAERLAASLRDEDPRQAIDVLWSYARQLGPSQQAGAVLVSLAERAKAELSDVELASQLLRKALETSLEPLGVRRRLAALYRDAGRFAELSLELRAIAELSLRATDEELAVAALDEAAQVCLQLSRVDEALEALKRARDIAEARGEKSAAAAFERRRAEALRDLKLDLEAAEEALRNSFEISKRLDTAQMGRALAQRRSDPGAEARWLERAIELMPHTPERAAALVALAELLGEELGDWGRAESTLRAAVELDPKDASAEELLTRILRAGGRLAELAGHYEQAALCCGEAARRSALWQSAARVHLELGSTAQAATALLAARSGAPEDLQLTQEAADLLHQAGRGADAAELDAALLKANPLQPTLFARHARFLARSEDHRGLATLMLARADRESGAAAADSYLEAAKAFRAAGSEGQAQFCEERAFQVAPGHGGAFEAMLNRARPDARRTSELLVARAEALPEQAVELHWQRAQLLLDAGELLLAAEALDELLASAPEHFEALGARAELAAAAGGPSAAQPFDRRILGMAGERLSAAARVKVCLRLGRASLAAGALQDAADVLEQAVQLDSQGEALSLLSEIYGRTGNAAGQYRTALSMARRAQPSEAEALCRRAADLFDDPKDAIDALLRLTQLRPLDVAVARRAVQGLKSLGRHSEVVDLCKRTAESVGGAVGAEMLLDAAKIAQEQLTDGAIATELLDRAYLLDPVIALADRFDPLMASGQFETALAVADRAGDADRARQALWGFAQTEGWSARADRLARELRESSAFNQLLELALVLRRAGSGERASELFEELALSRVDAQVRVKAVAQLQQRSQLERVVKEAAEKLDSATPAAWVDALVERARELTPHALAAVLEKAALASPEKACALRLELGKLCLSNLQRPDLARQAFELALAEDLECVPALHRLLELYALPEDARGLIAMVERLARLLGATAVESHRERLAQAYEVVGRNQDALHLLSLLQETPARLRQRADLTAKLGLTAESLQLRERVAETADEQQAVLLSYLEAGLSSAAVSLANGMLERGHLSAAIRRTLAQRLSTSAEGAMLSASLWPELLREDASDAEGWRSFAEALRRLRQSEAAELAHGFFLGLSGAPSPSAMPAISALEMPALQSEAELPVGALAITGQSMPRLHRALGAALYALGARMEQLYLDPAGGAEAYLLRPDQLLLGAGALGCFGPAELAFLCALALALGERGRSLATVGPVEGLDEAAAAAFEAVPSSLAACRVLTVLDDRVRGSDPSRMNALEVLSRSSAFRTVAAKALALM
jgi:tetratricopeptide (TPR) repeat protein